MWKAKWSRGTAPNPRQPALKAYAAALKRGSSPAEILAGVKARVGVAAARDLAEPGALQGCDRRRGDEPSGQGGDRKAARRI
jgi:hypothetical protein